MAEGNAGSAKNNNFIDTRISIGQIGIVISIVASALIFYFTGQTNVGERINKLENDMNHQTQQSVNDVNHQMQQSIAQLSDRIGKNETRIAVIEQHQIQEDSGIADTRTSLNSFIVDVRQQLSRIFDQVSDLRPLLQTRDAQRPTLHDGR
jgi:hypothetical protein